jgi:four helix bundle protein
MQNEECKLQNGIGPLDDELSCDNVVGPQDHKDLSDRLLGFAVRVGKLVDALPKTRLGRHIAGQLIRSGTSAAPNYEEACAAESRADFVHKLSICLKELRESRFWIRLIVESELLPAKKMLPLQDECTQLCKIFAQSLVTAKKNESRGMK